MLVTCPNCQSIFKLPDNDNPNLKMRCSICSNVFALKDAVVLPNDAPLHNDSPKKSYNLDSSLSATRAAKGKQVPILSIIFTLLFFAIIGGYAAYRNPDLLKEMFGSENIETMEKKNKEIDDLMKRVELLEVSDFRQFIVSNKENDKFEQLTVVEGNVINNFDEPRGFIELEVTLFDTEGNPLEVKTQMAGPQVSFFQLQVLGKPELEEALRDNISILNYNTNVKPKEKTPFMLIFYNPPATAANFNIRIIGAQIPELEKVEEGEKPK